MTCFDFACTLKRAANSRPYGTDERFPVGAIAESPAIMAQFGKRAVEGAGPYGTDERFPAGAIAESPANMVQFGNRAVESAGPYGFVSSSRVWVKP